MYCIYIYHICHIWIHIIYIYDTWYCVYIMMIYIYDIWFMIYDVYMIYDIWCIYDIWYMIYDTWYMIYIYILILILVMYCIGIWGYGYEDMNMFSWSSWSAITFHFKSWIGISPERDPMCRSSRKSSRIPARTGSRLKGVDVIAEEMSNG